MGSNDTTERRQLIKLEIMSIINASPEAMHSIGGLFDRLRDKVTHQEVERAITCLLANNHIKKLGAHVFGFGNGEQIKPFNMDKYDPFALDKPTAQPQFEVPPKRGPKPKPQQKKTMQEWSGGTKQPEPEKPAATESEQPAKIDNSFLNSFQQVILPLTSLVDEANDRLQQIEKDLRECHLFIQEQQLAPCPKCHETQWTRLINIDTPERDTHMHGLAICCFNCGIQTRPDYWFISDPATAFSALYDTYEKWGSKPSKGEAA